MSVNQKMNIFLADMLKSHPQLESCIDDMTDTFELMSECYRNGGKVLICGNGGSAADAEHWAGELMKGFLNHRPLSDESRKLLSDGLAENLQGALPTIPLTGFISFNTAFSNDNNAEYLFAQLVWGFGKKGDMLVGISTSGNSQNILLAIETARAMGMKTVGMTGRTGGDMAGNVDVSVKVPADKVHHIQELHVPVYHTLSMMLEEEFFPESHVERIAE